MTEINKKYIIETKNAPAAIGPYSQAVSYNGLLFCSGQIPIDPHTGGVVGGNLEAQSVRVMENLSEVLKAAGLDFNHVLKTTIFLRNMNDFERINDIYGNYFETDQPARETVEVSRLPKDVLIEISCIAAAPTDYSKRENASPNASKEDTSKEDTSEEE